MSFLEKCHRCGGKMELRKTEFELRAFVMRAGPDKGNVNYSVIPDGLEVPMCTENGCGEQLYDKKTCEALDAAKAFVAEKEPALKLAIGIVREQLQQWVQKK